MTLGKISRSFGTHDGTFHADEVTACALLLLFDLIDQDKIARTRDPEILKRCEFVCDVGGIFDDSIKHFDHHQADYKGTLSSAGMILEFLRNEKIITLQEYTMFNQTIITGVDNHDNGIDLSIPGITTYSNIISNFTPIEHDATKFEQEECFKEALGFSYGHLDRLYKRYKYIHSCRKIVEDEMKKKREYLFFDKPLPWLESFFELDGENHGAKFVIMPSGNHWKLRGIPPNLKQRMQVRVPLPEKWAGLLENELKTASGIEGAVFCHKGRFISVWETKEDALKALEKVLKGVKVE